MAMLNLLERMSDDRTAQGLSRWVDPLQGNRDITVHGSDRHSKIGAAIARDLRTTFLRRALAHASGDKIEAAYARSDVIDKRRKLMKAWAEYCTPSRANGSKISSQILSA